MPSSDRKHLRQVSHLNAILDQVHIDAEYALEQLTMHRDMKRAADAIQRIVARTKADRHLVDERKEVK